MKTTVTLVKQETPELRKMVTRIKEYFHGTELYEVVNTFTLVFKSISIDNLNFIMHNLYDCRGVVSITVMRFP